MKQNPKSIVTEADMIYEMLDKFVDVQGEIVSGAVLSYDGSYLEKYLFLILQLKIVI